MEKTLRRLETFRARGSDGQDYTVHGFEHLARIDARTVAQDPWESTGQAEYKLADGRHVDVAGNGEMRVSGSDLRLARTG